MAELRGMRASKGGMGGEWGGEGGSAAHIRFFMMAAGSASFVYFVPHVGKLHVRRSADTYNMQHTHVSCVQWRGGGGSLT